MSIKDQQVSIYQVLEVIADAWIEVVAPACYYDCSDSLGAMHEADSMMDTMSKALGAPTTMVNFVKAYKKTDYVKTIKEYVEESGDTFDPADFITPPAIKITQKDIDAL